MGTRQFEETNSFIKHINVNTILFCRGKYLGVDERVILKWILSEIGLEGLDGFISLRIATRGRLFLNMVMKLLIP
jgi:hypothetical protein